MPTAEQNCGLVKATGSSGLAGAALVVDFAAGEY